MKYADEVESFGAMERREKTVGKPSAMGVQCFFCDVLEV